MSADCLFCKIIAGDIPSNKVYSDAHVYAFHDINPAAPTHVLVIPKKHLSAVNDGGEENEALLGKLLLAANKIAAKLELADDGFAT
jgi:histidine triad (HIT) family protein